MYSVIRDVPKTPWNTRATVVQYGSSQYLELLVYDDYDDSEPVVMSRFNINWIEKEERVDWLANMFINHLQNAYWNGKYNRGTEIQDLARTLFKQLGLSR